MRERSEKRSPSRLVSWFIVASGIPLAGFAWLGYRTLDQQDALDRERQETRVANAATVLARELDRTLADWDRLGAAATQVTDASTVEGLPHEVAIFVLDAGDQSLLLVDGARLPYYPAVPSSQRLDERVFADAYRAEYVDKDDELAMQAYAGLVRDGRAPVRAAALAGAARCAARLGRTREALESYDRLALVTGATIAGAPPAFVAHRERLRLFERTGDASQAARERAWLTEALTDGRIPIDRGTYDEAVASLNLSPLPVPPRVALAEAAHALEARWAKRPDGRAGMTTAGGSFVAVWRTEGARRAVIVAPLKSAMAPLYPLAEELDVTFTLADAATGVGGDAPTSVLRPLDDLALPWTLSVSSRQEPSAAWLTRQQMFAFGLGLMTLVVAGASYAVYRSVSKELNVARLQSDFVAAVSHEFRTPLAAVRHLSDMLEHDTAPGDQRPEYYRAIGRETRRLQALVENLLDFGRLEAGRRYDLAPVDLSSLAQDVITDCADRAALTGHRLHLTGHDAPSVVLADREAIGLALRNLIDNAIKYSPAADAVDVRLGRDDEMVTVAVQDYGVGIDGPEQRTVFGTFVRGSAARDLMVKGTGIGLAMADRIVRAHGGSLTLESAPGHGSTFTIGLPLTHA